MLFFFFLCFFIEDRMIIPCKIKFPYTSVQFSKHIFPVQTNYNVASLIQHTYWVNILQISPKNREKVNGVHQQRYYCRGETNCFMLTKIKNQLLFKHVNNFRNMPISLAYEFIFYFYKTLKTNYPQVKNIKQNIFPYFLVMYNIV